eukprot:m.181308 g.181308  ORF g.181308 m.181308 type:complete len:833 (-) comp32058_c1_seq1:92-2590(-)
MVSPKKQKKNALAKAAAAAAVPPRPVDEGPPKLNFAGDGIPLKDQPEELQIRLFSLYFFLVCYLNLKALRADEAWTTDDPSMVNIAMLVSLGLFILVRRAASSTVFAMFALLLGSLVFTFGCANHVIKFQSYEESEDYPMWKYSVLVHTIGTCILVHSSFVSCKAAKIMESNHMMLIASMVAVIAIVPALLRSPLLISQPLVCGDALPFTSIANPIYRRQHEFSSRYIDMEDGVRLAADIHVPNKKWEPENISYPTILLLTRYSRNIGISWPFNKFKLFSDKDKHRTNLQLSQLTVELTRAGYAVVVVDVRGTGASTGKRPVDSHPREVKDQREVLDWINAQGWSNGVIGAAGFGYDGVSSAQLASRGGVKAIALMFSSFDAYTGEVAPGGIPCTGFLEGASRMRSMAESGSSLAAVVGDDGLSWHRKLWLEGAFSTVTGVDGWEDMLPSVLDGHANNFDALTHVPVYKDDVLFVGKTKNLSYVELGEQDRLVAGLKRHNVNVLNIAGLFAGRTASDQSRLHTKLGNLSQLTLGPWASGAQTCYDAATGATTTQLQLGKVLRTYFDCHLKQSCGEDDTTTTDAVRWFNTGGEKSAWKSGDEWPPTGLEFKNMRLQRGGRLVDHTTKDTEEATETIEFTVGAVSTGAGSRWNFARAMFGLPLAYTTNTNADANTNANDDAASGLVRFTSAPLTAATTLVGSAILELTLTPLDGHDAAVFVYVYEVDADNRRRYITEGHVRASHRITSEPAVVVVGDAQPFTRSFKRADAKQLDGETLVKISLEPTAHTFNVGSRISIAITGSDTDNFDTGDAALAKTWSINLDSSNIALPVSV